MSLFDSLVRAFAENSPIFEMNKQFLSGSAIMAIQTVSNNGKEVA